MYTLWERFSTGFFKGRVFDREKHREPEWNITGQFVDLHPWKKAERAIVNELLDNSVRLNPSDRYMNAIQFKAWVDLAMKRIATGACVTDLRERLRCIFCGDGEYRQIIYRQDDEATASTSNSMKWLRLECNNCGNTQKFRLGKAALSNWRGFEGDV